MLVYTLYHIISHDIILYSPVVSSRAADAVVLGAVHGPEHLGEYIITHIHIYIYIYMYT